MKDFSHIYGIRLRTKLYSSLLLHHKKIKIEWNTKMQDVYLKSWKKFCSPFFGRKNNFSRRTTILPTFLSKISLLSLCIRYVEAICGTRDNFLHLPEDGQPNGWPNTNHRSVSDLTSYKVYPSCRQNISQIRHGTSIFRHLWRRRQIRIASLFRRTRKERLRVCWFRGSSLAVIASIPEGIIREVNIFYVKYSEFIRDLLVLWDLLEIYGIYGVLGINKIFLGLMGSMELFWD